MSDENRLQQAVLAELCRDPGLARKGRWQLDGIRWSQRISIKPKTRAPSAGDGTLSALYSAWLLKLKRVVVTSESGKAWLFTCSGSEAASHRPHKSDVT